MVNPTILLNFINETEQGVRAGNGEVSKVPSSVLATEHIGLYGQGGGGYIINQVWDPFIHDRYRETVEQDFNDYCFDFSEDNEVDNDFKDSVRPFSLPWKESILFADEVPVDYLVCRDILLFLSVVNEETDEKTVRVHTILGREDRN